MAFFDKIKSLDYKSLLGLWAIVFYPFLLLLIIGYFLIPYTYGYRRELVAFGSLSLVFICIVWLINNATIRKYLIVFFFFLLMLLCFFKLSFYYLYGAKINASALFIIFETNTSEASEFFSRYLDFKTLVFFIALVIPLVLLIRFLFFYKKEESLDT